MNKLRYQIKNNDKLLNMALSHTGNGFAHIVARTIPAMRKTNNPFYGNVYKITDAQIQNGFKYINSVNNQLAREGKPLVKQQPRQWGKRIEGTGVVEHTKKGETEKTFYLEAKIERINFVGFYDIETGEEIERETLAPWLTKKGESSTQASLEKKIIYRDFALSSILWIRMDGIEIDNRVKQGHHQFALEKVTT
jgi:hypothetical protein